MTTENIKHYDVYVCTPVSAAAAIKEKRESFSMTKTAEAYVFLRINELKEESQKSVPSSLCHCPTCKCAIAATIELEKEQEL